jgi:hypothetical protein
MIIYKRMITFLPILTSLPMIAFEPVITSLPVITREKEKMLGYLNRECRSEASFDWIIV